MQAVGQGWAVPWVCPWVLLSRGPSHHSWALPAVHLHPLQEALPGSTAVPSLVPALRASAGLRWPRSPTILSPSPQEPQERVGVAGRAEDSRCPAGGAPGSGSWQAAFSFFRPLLIYLYSSRLAKGCQVPRCGRGPGSPAATGLAIFRSRATGLSDAAAALVWQRHVAREV